MSKKKEEEIYRKTDESSLLFLSFTNQNLNDDSANLCLEKIHRKYRQT